MLLQLARKLKCWIWSKFHGTELIEVGLLLLLLSLFLLLLHLLKNCISWKQAILLGKIAKTSIYLAKTATIMCMWMFVCHYTSKFNYINWIVLERSFCASLSKISAPQLKINWMRFSTLHSANNKNDRFLEKIGTRFLICV